MKSSAGMTTNTLQPGQSYSKICGKEPRYNEILVITNTIWKPKRVIYPDVTNKCQHVTIFFKKCLKRLK